MADETEDVHNLNGSSSNQINPAHIRLLTESLRNLSDDKLEKAERRLVRRLDH